MTQDRHGAVALALSLVAAAVAIAAPALAADDTTVNAGGLFAILRPYIEAAAGAAVLALVTWLATTFQRLTGIQIEAKHREAIQTAAMTGASKVLAGIQGRADLIEIDVGSPMVAEGVAWVQRSVPDAVRYFGATPDALAGIVAGKFGQLQVEAQAGAPGPAPTAAKVAAGRDDSEGLTVTPAKKRVRRQAPTA